MSIFLRHLFRKVEVSGVWKWAVKSFFPNKWLDLGWSSNITVHRVNESCSFYFCNCVLFGFILLYLLHSSSFLNFHCTILRRGHLKIIRDFLQLLDRYFLLINWRFKQHCQMYRHLCIKWFYFSFRLSLLHIVKTDQSILHRHRKPYL